MNVQLSPPSEIDFPYPVQLARVYRPQAARSAKLRNCRLYDLLPPPQSRGHPSFSIVVSRPPEDGWFQEPSSEDRSALLLPDNHLSYRNVNGLRLRALFYSRFKTLSEFAQQEIVSQRRLGYTGERPVIVDDKFRPLIKGFLESFVYLEKKRFDPWIVNEHTLVLREGSSGSLLCNAINRNTRSQDDWTDDILHLRNVIDRVFDVSRSSRAYKSLDGCMRKALSKERRERLLSSPYFLSDKQIVQEYLPRMYLAGTTNYSFGMSLENRTYKYDWWDRVSGVNHQFDWIVRGRGYYGPNGSEFMRAIRNCRAHVSDELNERLKRQCEATGRVHFPRMAELARNYAQMVQLVNIGDPWLLDDLFSWTYETVEHTIHAVDA